MNDHEPITFENFGGYWVRDFRNQELCPKNHFIIASNLMFGEGSVLGRKPYQRVTEALAPINTDCRRAFIFNASQGRVFLIFMDFAGKLYTQQIAPSHTAAPILRADGGLGGDFDMVAFNNRAYIVFSLQAGYRGNVFDIFDGTTYRRGGCSTPATNANIALYGNPNGHIEAGIHYFGVVFETDSGFLSVPAPTNPTYVISNGHEAVQFTNIPIGPANVVARRLIATRVVSLPAGTVPYNNGIEVYETFFIPHGRIPNNTQTSLPVDFLDAELLANSSYLLDIYPVPPGGTSVSIYHNRIVITAAVGASVDGVSGIAISNVNDPETFNQVDGIIIADPSKNLNITCDNGDIINTGLTDAQIYRDTLYVFRLNGTYGITDNGDVPSTWPLVTIDEALGSFLHGTLTVLDTGGINIEYLLIGNKSGIYLFTGLFNEPAITWKVEALWKDLKIVPAANDANVTLEYAGQSKMHFVNDSLNKRIYAILGYKLGWFPEEILYGDYSDVGSTNVEYHQKVKWCRWRSDLTKFWPTSLISYNDGAKSNVLITDKVSLHIYSVEDMNRFTATVFEDMVVPHLATALVTGKTGTVLHFNAVRVNLVGNRVSSNTMAFAFRNANVLEPSHGRFQAISTLTVEPFAQRVIEVLANYTAQKASVSIAGYDLNINSITVFQKPIFNNIPRTLTASNEPSNG